MEAPLRLNRRSGWPSVITDVGQFARSTSRVAASSDRATSRRPHILLVTAVRLPSTARLALEFQKVGGQVSLIAPSQHPAEVLSCFKTIIRHSAWRPTALLERALRRLQPDAVIACDEQSVRDLQTVHRCTHDQDIKMLLEDSLGHPESFPIVTSRDLLLSVARDLNIRVPDSVALPEEAALDGWLDPRKFPVVLKADGSWAGFGVRVISDASEAHRGWHQMRRPPSLYMALRAWALDRDATYARSWLRQERPTLSAQAFIDGRPGNIGVACRRGRVLAAICAESVATVSATGPSTVTRIIRNPEMVEAATRIVAALGLSGFVGFDFMIEAATGDAYMIEINPRVTPICTIPLGSGRDLPEAFTADLEDRPVKVRPSRTERDVIAYFPDTWELDPASHFLHNVFHDVPWEEPAVVRRLVQPELRDRNWALRQLRLALQRYRQRRGTFL